MTDRPDGGISHPNPNPRRRPSMEQLLIDLAARHGDPTWPVQQVQRSSPEQREVMSRKMRARHGSLTDHGLAGFEVGCECPICITARRRQDFLIKLERLA